MTQIGISYIIYGDLQGLKTPPTVDQITSLVGLEPSSAVLERDVLVWQYETPKEPVSNCYELIYELLKQFKHLKNAFALEFNIYCQSYS